MSGFGSDPFVERVREASDIVEVVGESVALKKAGSRFAGLCPFHREKTASFHVNPAMQVYHCFGCGAGGDVFSFVMAQEKLTFPEAVRHLAARAGIPLPEQRGPGADRLEKIREALRVGRAYFRAQLLGPAGRGARDYLAARAIPPATQEAYGLGFAPDGWDGLLRHGRELVSERSLLEAGLLAEAESGRVYDRFRNRVMIPIETPAGLPVGFGGRILGAGEPKYLNSPETAVYRKGSVLFGAGPAREGIRAAGRVVVVEGYFDVIALMQSGVPGVVGTCGTALTPEQGTALKRLSERIVLLFDGDEAGLRAALRAFPVLVGTVADVRVVRPPEGIDPDLWVREQGPAEVAAAIDHAPGVLAFLEDLVGRGVLTRRDAARSAAELAAGISDPLDRDLWNQDAAPRFGITSQAFGEAVRRIAARRTDGLRGGGLRGGSAGPGAGGTGEGPEGAREAEPARLPPWESLERACIRAALHRPEHAAELAEAARASAAFGEDFVEVLGRIAEAAQRPEAGAGDPAALLSQAMRGHVRAAELVAVGMAGEPPDPVPALLLGLRLRGLERRAAELQRGLRRAGEAGNLAEQHRFQEELLWNRTERLALTKQAQEKRGAGEGPAGTGLPGEFAGGGAPGAEDSGDLPGEPAPARPSLPDPPWFDDDEESG